jgi:hypothetical protein
MYRTATPSLDFLPREGKIKRQVASGRDHVRFCGSVLIFWAYTSSFNRETDTRSQNKTCVERPESSLILRTRTVGAASHLRHCDPPVSPVLAGTHHSACHSLHIAGSSSIGIS